MPARAFRRELRASYFAPFLAMTVLAGIVLWRVSAQVSSVEQVEHTNQVIRATRQAQRDALKMAVAIRSYWISADRKYLVALEDAERDLDATLATISKLIADNPAQSRRLLEVSALKRPWSETLHAAKQRLVAQAPLPLDLLESQRQAVSKVLDEIVFAEDRLLKLRTARQRSEDLLIFLLVPLLSILTAAILSLWGWNQIGRASQKLAAALDRAEDASRAKDSFLATVSHELRNPLNSIMLLSSVLLSDPELHDKARKRAESIERAARVQARLIEDLLDVSRIESGHLNLDLQATDLAQVVKEALEDVRVAAEAKSITLQESIDPGVTLIAGDPKRLQQVIWNLLSNAVKFTPHGGKILVRLERINADVEITVADSGQGMEAASLPRVFDRFWQQPNSAGRNPGVGLGLSIVKELVILHGGTVTAHSDGYGKGSVFTVQLPLPPIAGQLLDPSMSTGVLLSKNAPAVPRLDGLSILVVVNHPEDRTALITLLDSLGATVAAATSATTALDRLHDAIFDVILADIGTAVEDGSAFARELRLREQEVTGNGHVPLVALTAYGRIEEENKLLAGGFDRQLVKPVDVAELSAAILSLIPPVRLESSRPS